MSPFEKRILYHNAPKFILNGWHYTRCIGKLLPLFGIGCVKGCVWDVYVDVYADNKHIITSLAKGGYVFGSVGLSVCLSVSEQHYSIGYEQIAMKFYWEVLGGTRSRTRTDYIMVVIWDFLDE